MAKRRKTSRFVVIARRFSKNRSAMIGLVIVVFFILVAVFADVIVPYDKALEQTMDIRQAPSAEHWFGTDTMGRDVFARMVHGSRPSILIGIIGTFISAFAGLIIGGIAGYYGGAIDNVLMRICDVFMCIPGTLLAMTVVTVLGYSLTNLIIALAVSAIPGFARENRALVMSVSEQDFVRAAKSYGASDMRIIFRYLVPNVMGPMIVSATMMISSMMLGAAGMSFLGMGIQPPQPEWGYMISDAKAVMRQAPYLMLIPGFATVILALGFNLVGDGLQDATNPKLKD